MSEIIQILILIIVGLFGMSRFQSRKTKKLDQDLQKVKTQYEEKQKEVENIHEVQKKIEEIKQTEAPKKVSPPAAGDAAHRLARLNKLHDSANGNT